MRPPIPQLLVLSIPDGPSSAPVSRDRRASKMRGDEVAIIIIVILILHTPNQNEFHHRF